MGWQPPSHYPPPPPQQKGLSTGAIVAIVIAGLVVVGVPILGIVAAIAIPSLLKAREAANESAAIGTVRTIGSAEALYAARHATSGGSVRYAPLDELARGGLVDQELAKSPLRNGYYFTVALSDDRTEFEVWADPASERPGQRHFYLGSDNELRVEEGRPAGPDSPTLGEYGERRGPPPS